MAAKSKKLYQGNQKKSKKVKSLYGRNTLILLAAFLYIILGFFEQIPFFVFQILFLMEGFAFFQDSFRSSLQKSNMAVGCLYVLWAIISSLRSGLTTGYAVSVSNQVIVCNMIYVAILGLVIFQTNKRKDLYYNYLCKNISVLISSISIVLILCIFGLIYMLQLTEMWDLEITVGLDLILRAGAKALEWVTRYPIAEWLLQVSIIASILLQSNKRYMMVYQSQKKHHELHEKHRKTEETKNEKN